MTWSQKLVMAASRDVLMDGIIELLKEMGFRDYERASGADFDLVAIRVDPVAGPEKLIVKLHLKGLAGPKDVSALARLLKEQKADKGLLISPAGFTRDVGPLVSENYRGKVTVWDGEKLASVFNKYSVGVPEGLKGAAEEVRGEETGKEKPEEIELDAPLLFDFSADEIMKRVSRYIASKYPVEPREVGLESLKVELREAYVISWGIEGSEERGRAVVFSPDEIVLKAGEDGKLSRAVRKALISDTSRVKATGIEVERPISATDAVVLLKSLASRKFSVNENRVTIVELRKVYIPEKTLLKLKIGDNEAEGEVDLEKMEMSVELKPLPEAYFMGKAREILKEETGEMPVEVEMEKGQKKIKLRGRTERFSFLMAFNPYTGRLLGVQTEMTEEALEALLRETFPTGKVLGVERDKKTATADVLVGGAVKVVKVDLRNGKVEEVGRLPAPNIAFVRARETVIRNFPISDVKLGSYRVVNHKYLELELTGEDGRAVVKIDGKTGEVLDYLVEVSEKKARELVKEKYPGYEIVSISESKDEYIVSAIDETSEVRVRLSKDGKTIEEEDRILRRQLAEKIAEERAREIDPEARIEGVELRNDWVATFIGVRKVGKLVLARGTGELLKVESELTERAIEEEYHKRLRGKYKEENPRTERLTHYKDRNYVHIKVSGRDRLYYARIDTRTGEVLSEDTVPKRGLTARIRQMQLENRYR
ncbi:restriction endonuclease [Thermococcus sp.]